MSKLRVAVCPTNPDKLTVRVWLMGGQGTPSFRKQYTVTPAKPLDRTWTVQPGQYVVEFEWTGCQHNINPGSAGNGIWVNDGQSLYYQAAGNSLGQLNFSIGFQVT